jgi:hypothetical protein
MLPASRFLVYKMQYSTSQDKKIYQKVSAVLIFQYFTNFLQYLDDSLFILQCVNNGWYMKMEH